MNTVIQVVQHLRPGGIETMALDLATFCDHHENTLIVSLEGDRDSAIAAWPRLAQYADSLIFLGKKPGLRPSLILTLTRLFMALKADVVHTHHIGPLVYAGLAARAAKVGCLIHTEHDAWHLENTHRRTLQRRIIRLTRPILVADAQTVADAMKILPLEHDIQIVRNGIDTERFKPGNQYQARRRLVLPLDVPLIGCSGRLEEVKGQSILIDAVAQMPGDPHLALAGTGSTEAALRHQAQTLGLENRIHFLGHVDDMPTFYQALDAFCLPSLNEGLPLAPLEAQACAIPTVVTDVGGSHETLCPQSGELIPSGDACAMASTLVCMLKKPKQATHTNPRHFVQQQGDVRLMAQAYADLHFAGT